MIEFFRKNWFMLMLLGVAGLAVGDVTGTTVRAGLWLGAHRGPDAVIVLIFFLSGLPLDGHRVRDGLADWTGTLLALALIFLAGPLVGALLGLLPLSGEILVGLALVAVMPTTLSSGVVMTGAAGGNMAHALLITILSNGLAVFTVPVSLGLLLSLAGNGRTVVIDPLPTMFKIGTLVLLPLALGMGVRTLAGRRILPLLPGASVGSQVGILAVVWMGACLGREAIVDNLDQALPILGLSVVLHGLLLAVAFAAAHLAGRPKGRRESVILMGCQKTLPLSIILQVAFFPEYGLALVVCVLHHVVHLVMDAAVVRHLRRGSN